MSKQELKIDRRNTPDAIASRTLPEIRHGRHCVFNLHVHLVFVTKYRKNTLSKNMLEFLEENFKDTCCDFNSKLMEFEGEHDHVHLLIEYPPKVSISKMVNSLKGVSARMLRKKYGDQLSKKLWGDSLWSPSYFAGSCGGAPLSIIKQYIQKQNRPSV